MTAGYARSSAPARSGQLFQLLDAAHDRRHRRVGKAGLPVGDADFADVNVALGVEREAVRREEFADIETRPVLAAEPPDLLALRIHDGEARADIVVVPVHRHAGAKLADDEVRLLAAAATQRAGPM